MENIKSFHFRHGVLLRTHSNYSHLLRANRLLYCFPASVCWPSNKSSNFYWTVQHFLCFFSNVYFSIPLLANWVDWLTTFVGIFFVARQTNVNLRIYHFWVCFPSGVGSVCKMQSQNFAFPRRLQAIYTVHRTTTFLTKTGQTLNQY